MSAPQFESVPTPPDTLWLTPDASGIRFTLAPLPDGSEVVAVMFCDPVAGNVSFAFDPSSARVITDGITKILDNVAYLRVENNKIRNREEH